MHMARLIGQTGVGLPYINLVSALLGPDRMAKAKYTKQWR